MKQYKSRDKITQKMTRDGLIEVNETQQTAERISKREQDADFQKSPEQQAAQDGTQLQGVASQTSPLPHAPGASPARDTATAERVMEHIEAAQTRRASKKAVHKAQEEVTVQTTSSRLQFTEEELAVPELECYIEKSNKAADRLDAAKAAIPKQKKLVKERTFDEAAGKAKTRLHFEEQEKPIPGGKKGNPLSRPAQEAGIFVHNKIHSVEKDNSGVEGAHKSEELAERGAKYGARKLKQGYRSHKLKPYREAAKAEKAAFKANVNFQYHKTLRIAACLEEHFPHSMAKAVVDAAKEKHLDHEEMHSKVEYIVAHGISTTINGEKAIIGSYHFVFEDENSIIPEGMEEKFRHLPEEYSHLYLALEGVLAAVICIEDPLRPEAAEIIRQLKKAGLKKIVMMTGDSERTAKAIAKKVGVDEYYAEVLPEDKANFVEKEKAEGRKVIMIGDGINDSPALSAADVGIAISEGAEIAREIADITVAADDLAEILVLRMLSNRLMKRIHKNYRFIVTFNAGLILLGVGGILQPTTSALLHNTSTLYIGLKSMGNLLDEPV